MNGHLQLLCSQATQLVGSFGRRVSAFQPLSQQRAGLAILHCDHISLKLIAEDMEHVGFQAGIDKDIKVIPAAILCDVFQVLAHLVGMILRQPLHCSTGDISLGQTATNIPRIEHHLHGQLRIFVPCGLHGVRDVIQTPSHAANAGEQVENCTISAVVGLRTIQGVGRVGFISGSIYKIIHRYISFHSLSRC